MNERIRYLDGLRGVLAIIVFLHHYFYAFCPKLIFGENYGASFRVTSFYTLTALTPVNILFNPGMAIHFFFLLSGYVQTRNYFIKPDATFLQKSLIKRYFRLALPTLSVVLLVFTFHKLRLVRKDLIPVNALTSGWVKSLLPDNLSFFQVVLEGLSNCFRGTSRYYQVLWTMPTELFNSFAVLGLLLILHNMKNKTRIFIFLITIQCFVLSEYYSAAFMFGMLFAKLQLDSEKFKKVLSVPFAKFSCLLLGLYFGSFPFTGYKNAVTSSVYSPVSFFEVYPHVMPYLIGIIFLFCFLLFSKAAQNILSKKIFLFWGKISFMFYLVHFLLLLSFTPWLYNALGSFYSVSITFIITGVLSFIFITITAALLTRFIDKPVIRGCNWFVKKFF
jgi:peptidoglycan/LPS O-acetylase OafA/YrhL